MPSFTFVFETLVNMEAGEDQNTGSANGNTQPGTNSRPPQIAHMSLYERQAVQVRDLVLVWKRTHIWST